MGQKRKMEKIVDAKKCQITYSKRRSSLMKKLQEIAMLCDAKVAFVSFSSAGRVHKFCSPARIEDVLQRYISLPTQQRLIHMRNTQEKLERLSEVNRFMGDNTLDHLEQRVESFEDQIRKSNEVMEFLEANLRDFEPSPEVVPSLHKYSWCERNLMHSLKSVMIRKHQGKFLGSSSSSLGLPNYQIRDKPATFKLNDMGQNKERYPTGPWQMEMFNQGQRSDSPSFPSQLLTELDPWISPYSHSARERERIFQSLLDESNGEVVSNNNAFNLMKAQVEQNAPFGVQKDQPYLFGHHMENQNMQDGSLPLNLFHTNNEVLHPFPTHNSSRSSMKDSRLGSNRYELYKVPFDWEIPESSQQQEVSALKVDFSNPMKDSGLGSNRFELYKVPFDWEIPEPNQQHEVSAPKVDFSNPQSSLSNMDSNLRTWNDGTSHEIRGFSHALSQPDPILAVHEAPYLGTLGGTNQWTAGNQNNREMEKILDDLLKELFSD